MAMTKSELATVAKTLGAMFNCFPQSVLADPDLQVHGYLAAVNDCEVSDVLEACKRFIQGNVPDWNNAFCPSSAQLCHEVRRVRKLRQMREEDAARGDKANGNIVRLAVLPDHHFLNRAARGEVKAGE